MNIKHHELVSIANEFLNENYEMKLDIPIEFNQRLKRVFARFKYFVKDKVNIPDKIEMSIQFIVSHDREVIIDVLKHELVHYALCSQNKQFKDGQKTFEDELKRLGIKRTGVYTIKGDTHKYVCSRCGQSYNRLKLLPKTARCNCALDSSLIYEGIVAK